MWIAEVGKAQQLLEEEDNEGEELDEGSNVMKDQINVYERPCTRASGRAVLNVEWVQSKVLERKKRKRS